MLVKKRVVGIIQARMGSSRRPGKSLADLAGKPLLYRFIERVKRAKELDEIVLATTGKKEDDVLAKIAADMGIQVYRGSENDLVDRYYQAAKQFNADVVVRLCADNPVVEPGEVDRIVQFHLQSDNDFSSNTNNIDNNGYPDGLGAEVYNFETFERLRETTSTPSHREHPHSYIYENRAEFKFGTIPCPPEFVRPELKLDVNTEEEYLFLKAIYDYWYGQKKDFHITDILWWYDNCFLKSQRVHVS